MTNFVAYFDASGHPNDDRPRAAFFVSGFVSTEDKWREFEVAWLNLLSEYEIRGPFHMTDFEAFKGPYTSWKESGDDVRRTDFLKAAVKVIKRHTNRGFSTGIALADRRRVFEEYEVHDMPPEPYPWCAIQSCRKLFSGLVIV